MVEVGALEKMDKYGRVYYSCDSCNCDEESLGTDASRLEGDETNDEEVFEDFA